MKFFFVFLCQRCREIWREIWREIFRATFSRVWVCEGKFHQNFTSKTVGKTENFTQISVCWGAALTRDFIFWISSEFVHIRPILGNRENEYSNLFFFSRIFWKFIFLGFLQNWLSGFKKALLQNPQEMIRGRTFSDSAPKVRVTGQKSELRTKSRRYSRADPQNPTESPRKGPRIGFGRFYRKPPLKPS